MAPPAAGKPYQTTWFYERSRGKWEQEQMKLTESKRKTFCEQHPKNQVIKKEKLAKCLNTIMMNPHQVCQSSAINFSKFADYVEKLYDESKESINEQFFKKGVCSVIMFDELDVMVNKAPWYPKGGDKAQIVPYTIAKLMSLIPAKYDLDWKTIWNKQTMYPALANELIKLAKVTQEFLIEQAGGGLVRSISRTQGVWTNYQKVKYELSDSFINSLFSKEETKAEEAAAKKEHKFNADIEASVEIFKLGADYWMNFYNDAMKKHLLPYGDLDFIMSIAKCIKSANLPTKRQCDRLLKIVSNVEDKGYVMP